MTEFTYQHRPLTGYQERRDEDQQRPHHHGAQCSRHSVGAIVMTAIAIVLLVACMCIVSAGLGVLVALDLRRARRERAKAEWAEALGDPDERLSEWKRNMDLAVEALAAASDEAERPVPSSMSSSSWKRTTAGPLTVHRQRVESPDNAASLIGKPFLDTDGKQIGEVTGVASSPDVGAVATIRVDEPGAFVPSPMVTSAGFKVYAGLALLLAAGCGPSSIASSGGEAGETGAETGGELPMPGTEVVCVDMTPGSTTCWVAWEAGVSAQVLLECQAADRVSAGDWTPAYEDEIPGWGLVLCHDDIGGAGTRCLFDAGRVLLTEGAGGWWEPGLSAVAALYEPVEPPCGAEPDPNECGSDICTDEHICLDDVCCIPGEWECECDAAGGCAGVALTCTGGLCLPPDP